MSRSPVVSKHSTTSPGDRRSPRHRPRDDEFLKKFEASDQKNLQLEAVRRLISNEVKMIGKRNVVAGRKSPRCCPRRSTATRTAPSTLPR
jgi:hypothetical protein